MTSLTELFERLYPIACTCGVDPVRYWDMTYREIRSAIKAFQERQKIDQERLRADMQIQAMVAYREALLIGAVVARVLGDKHKLPSLEEAFPGVFPEEMLRPRQQDWRVIKARIEQYGAEWKRKRGEQRGNDDRGAAGANHRGDQAITASAGPGQKTTRANGSRCR